MPAPCKGVSVMPEVLKQNNPKLADLLWKRPTLDDEFVAANRSKILKKISIGEVTCGHIRLVLLAYAFCGILYGKIAQVLDCGN